MVNPKSLANLTNHKRKKGSKNKFTSLKDSFLKAFEEIENSEENLLQWATKNKRDFYGMVSKMLPAKIDTDGDVNALTILKLAETIKAIANDKNTTVSKNLVQE